MEDDVIFKIKRKDRTLFWKTLGEIELRANNAGVYMKIDSCSEQNINNTPYMNVYLDANEIVNMSYSERRLFEAFICK